MKRRTIISGIAVIIVASCAVTFAQSRPDLPFHAIALSNTLKLDTRAAKAQTADHAVQPPLTGYALSNDFTINTIGKEISVQGPTTPDVTTTSNTFTRDTMEQKSPAQ